MSAVSTDPTVDDVAARAEVSKGTIYLYFESKEEILAHLLLEGLDLLLDEMEAACDRRASPGRRARPAGLANAYLGFCQSHPSYFRLIMAFDRGRFEESISPELYQQVLDKSLQGLDLVAQTIEPGKRVRRLSRRRSMAGCRFDLGRPERRAGPHGPPPAPADCCRSDLETMFQATLDLVVDEA